MSDSISDTRARVRRVRATDASRIRRLHRRRNLRTIWLFLLPAIACLGTFHIWPIGEAVWLSLTDASAVSGRAEFVGLENYARALTDSQLHSSLGVTAWFLLLKVPLQVVLGLMLALFLRRVTRLSTITRTIVLVPTITSIAVVSTLFGLIYHPGNGLANGVLKLIGVDAQPFLTSPDQALPAIAAMMIWKDVGFTMLLFLAGVMAIPGEYYEAARVDGASRFKSFLHITLPLLLPVGALILLLEAISAFKVFAPVLLLTRGGPAGSTRVIVDYIFEVAFRFGELGYGSAVAVGLLALLVVAGILRAVVQNRTKEGA